MLLALPIAIVVAAAGVAVVLTSGRAPAATPGETVAGSPPSLVAGRGAAVPFVEQEAANSKTNGTVLSASRDRGTLASEAIGRRAVTLKKRGQYVEFTLTQPANAIDVRYSIPDSKDGSPYNATLSLYLDGVKSGRLTLTNTYAWYYGAYPFVNEPTSGNPHHFYDETHLLLGKEMPAGSKFRLQIDNGDNATSYTIDLVDFEEVAPPLPQPPGSVSVVSVGADPTGTRDSTDAFKKAISASLATGTSVWLPPGTYHVDKHLVVNSNVTIAGAGAWYSVMTGDGVGIYGNLAPHPSLNVHLSNFAIEGTVTERVDSAQVNGLGGALGGGSIISDLWIEHTKVGMWFDGPFDGLTIENNRIDDTTADGINLHDGITHATVRDTFIRNTGDDGIALWSEDNGDTDDVVEFNTVEAPILANDIAIYGGADNQITDNVVADSQTQGGGIHVANRFNAIALAGTTTIARDTALRTGSFDPNWKYGVGALWFWANDSPMNGAIRVHDVDLIDSSYEALEFAGSSITNVAFTDVRIAGAGTFALQLESHGEASFDHVVATGLGARAAIYDCLFTGSDTPAFIVDDRGGNSGWAKKYCGKWPDPVRASIRKVSAARNDFTLTLQPSGAAVDTGGAVTARVSTAIRAGQSQQLRLSAAGAPAGVSVRFSSSRLLAGGHATMTVTTQAGVRSGKYPIVVTSTGPTGAHSATFALTVAGPPVLTADPASIDFTAGSVGTPSESRQIRLKNTGTALITVGAIRTTGDFSQTNTCGGTIAAGMSCHVSVTFTATGTGARTGSVTIADDANPVTVRLFGTATPNANLALGKAASASGTQPGYPPSNMTDGNPGSYWESINNAFPQWATVDLGEPAMVSRIVLTLPPPAAWSARTQTLVVSGSLDNTTFTSLVPSAGYTFDPATGNQVAISFAPTKLRFIRLDVTANTGWPAAQFSEVEVFPK